ncbi:MAG: glycosyltransferase [Candidatus Atribacteria bacterium]|nr:MAG: glycosyltransferase [Candidatus Atribacteria bacterium]
MKILIVCSSRAKREGYFTAEQAEDLRRAGHAVGFFYILRIGLWGYVISWIPLIIRILSVRPDIVHAHYGLSGFVAVMQPFRPVVITVHGGDINARRNVLLTRLACRLANHVIIVNEDMRKMIRGKSGISLIPCAANTELFKPVDRVQARASLGMDPDAPVVLFASRFNKKVKNAQLAAAAVSEAKSRPRLMEVWNRSREEMPLLMNAADMLLVTSYYEGSPQIVKEAMACNIPVVSTDVGDIKRNYGDLPGCFITGYDPADIAGKIDEAIGFRRAGMSTGGRDRLFLLGLDPDTVTGALSAVYSSVCGHNREE